MFNEVKRRRGRDEAAELASFMYTTSYMGLAQDDKPDAEMRGLLLGLPCSPLFFDIISQPLDRKLGRVVGNILGTWQRGNFVRGGVCTRYVDDITISSDTPLLKPERRRVIECIESFPGYKVNHRKAQRLALGRGTLTVTGLDIRPNRRWPKDPRVLIAPAGPLLAQVEAVLYAVEVKLDRGEKLTQAEIDDLHGQKSILHMAGDPRKADLSSVRALDRRYHRIVKRIAPHRQLKLF